ncbi:MAG: inositol monophosphatase family protein [Candidatus Limnocylindrales bacterium]
MSLLNLPSPETEIGAALEVALTACDEADAISLASFRRAMRIEAKPDASFVTEADTAVERAVRERITSRFPDHGLVGEEYGEEASESGRRWIIDPIDGTHNYMRGVPLYATLIGLEIDGRLALGAVSAPALHRRWFSWEDGGAWAVETVPGGWDRDSGQRLSVSAVERLDEASLVYSSFPSLEASGRAPGFGPLLSKVWRDRGLGDFYGYMLVAEGAADIMVEAELKVWDLAGPRAVLQHAGARVTDIEGGTDMPAHGVLATNGRLHDTVLLELAGAIHR